MRVRITIDTEVELPDDVGETARGYAEYAGTSVERVMEDEPDIWWSYLQGADPDNIRVEIVE